ncbi:hypothetical protein K0M31_015384 [Melipona bicolor]|uniref:Uncharacterized protein n=1 Tax=Melipona bicolor TaxID=60889 RepID=A0AA40FFJ3_9HYME|nr:hypothetical protein K0M31_015384 [Melipona bicolor]
MRTLLMIPPVSGLGHRAADRRSALPLSRFFGPRANRLHQPDERERGGRGGGGGGGGRGDGGGKAKARASVRTNSSVNALPPSTVGLLAKLPNQVSRFHASVIIACWKVDGSVRFSLGEVKETEGKLQVELFPEPE